MSLNDLIKGLDVDELERFARILKPIKAGLVPEHYKSRLNNFKVTPNLQWFIRILRGELLIEKDRKIQDGTVRCVECEFFTDANLYKDDKGPLCKRCYNKL